MLSGEPGHARHRSRAAPGFSLIELLVALALLGILLMLGFPSFSAWIRNTQVRTVGEALQNGLRLAQAEALRLNRPVVMAFTNSVTAPPSAAATWTAVANGKNWWLQTVPQFTDDGTGTFIAGGTLTDVASGVNINSTGSLSAICFNANGRVAATPTGGTGVTGASCTAGATTFQLTQANFNVAKGDRQFNVTVSVGGQVRLCDYQRTLAPDAPDGC